MSTEEALPLARKLAAIRRNIKPVEMRPADGDDPFLFAPVAEVLERVRGQLNRQKVLAVPSSEIDAAGLALVSVTFYDEEDPEAEPITAGPWPGEAARGDGDRPTSKAARNGLKGLYMSFFKIRTVDPEPRTPHEQRARDVKANPAMTPHQRKRLIGAVQSKAGLSDSEVLRIATGLLGLDTQLASLDSFPRDRIDDLLKAMGAGEK